MDHVMIKPIETEEEINGMGYVLYKSWHETYTDLIDSSYLAGVTREKGTATARKQKNKALVAVENGRVIGFGPYRDEEHSGINEIYAIYVLAQHHGKKVGYRLMNAAFEKLGNEKPIVLWVLKGNKNAICFYEQYGFCLDGTEKNVVLGSKQTELRMTFQGRK